jgi:uncharacterized protein YbjT (DUF2867 family)
MFVIAGITGNTGSAAAQALLDHGQKVRAIVRDTSKAKTWADKGVELVQGELTNAKDLTAAFKGADGAYVLSPPDYANPDPIAKMQTVAKAIREAALATSLARLVFLSSEGAHLESGNGPIRGLHLAEGILKGAAPLTTFLRAAYFQENWQSVIGLAEAQGIMPTMLSKLDDKRPMIAAKDIGREAARLLLEKSPPKIVELASEFNYSSEDAAQAMSGVLGKTVTPVQPPRDQWEGILTSAGLGAPFAALIAEMNDGINSGHVHFSGQGQSRKGPTTLKENVAGWHH